MQMPRYKVIVRTVLAWEIGRWQVVLLAKHHQLDRCTPPVRPMQVWADSGLVFVLVRMRGLVLVVMVLVVGMESMQVVDLLDVLHLVLNTRVGKVIGLRWRGGTVHNLPFVAFILQLERVGSLVVVIVMVLVVVALIGVMIWFVLTPLWRKWLDT
jgi:hypothetical protein